MKKMRRSTTNRMFAGVIGGIAEYVDVDATALRVLYVILVVFTGFFPGVIAYILMAIIMPSADHPIIHDIPPKKDTSPSSDE